MQFVPSVTLYASRFVELDRLNSAKCFITSGDFVGKRSNNIISCSLTSSHVYISLFYYNSFTAGMPILKVVDTRSLNGDYFTAVSIAWLPAFARLFRVVKWGASYYRKV